MCDEAKIGPPNLSMFCYTYASAKPRSGCNRADIDFLPSWGYS